MSFISVAGTIYHCTNCGSHLQIDYQGGATLTQVSDPVIAEQQLLREEFEQPKVRQETEDYQPPRSGLALLGFGQYLHQKVICDECFAKMDIDESEVKQLSVLLGNVDETVKQAVVLVRALCENPTLLDVEEVIGKPMFEELSGRSMLPARKQRKLNEIFQKWHCLDGFLSLRIKESLAGMTKPLPDIQLRAFVTNLNKRHLTTYIPKEIGATECLNPFICSEFSVRIPLSSTPVRRVFYKNSISLNQYKNKDYLFNQTHEALSMVMHDSVALFKNVALNYFVGVKI